MLFSQKVKFSQFFLKIHHLSSTTQSTQSSNATQIETTRRSDVHRTGTSVGTGAETLRRQTGLGTFAEKRCLNRVTKSQRFVCNRWRNIVANRSRAKITISYQLVVCIIGCSFGIGDCRVGHRYGTGLVSNQSFRLVGK